MMQQEKRHSASWLSVLFLWLICGNLHSAAYANDTLTNAADVLALPAKAALAGIPVSVKGIVTAAETDWLGRFFVQDSSGGVFVDNRDNHPPVPGDVVEVSGISYPGGYAPVITKPHWKKLGTAPLPEAKPISTERLMSGMEDSQRVEVSGIVRSAEFSGSWIGIELVSGGYRFRAFFPITSNMEPQSLVGDKVLVRGTAAAAFNAPLRHLLTVTIFSPQPADFIVKEPAPTNLFDEPVVPLNNIAQYHKNGLPGNQVHVKGVVTYQRKGEDLFLRDATGGLQVKSKLTATVVPGDMVEAIGFPAVENFLPVLEDAVFRKTAEPKSDLEPMNTTVADLQKGLHHADFITLQGRLIERLEKGIGQRTDATDTQTILVIQTTNFVFTAEKETAGPSSFLGAIPIGSLVEVRGICLLESGDDGKIKSIRLLLPTSLDVRVIKKPGWLTPKHLLASLAVVFVVLLVAIGWSIMVAKKNFTLKTLVQEKEAAQHELQQAHDQLDARVKERTAQLKVEMTARKESELQFRAVLTERTRLAQELHDTLEQSLTGIAVQQDLVANQLGKNSDRATQHLKLARNLMRQSQVDLRRSVWGLRSRSEEEFNLASALLTNVRQMTDDTGIRVEVETVGKAGFLSEIVEENLLRIGQEAMTNVVKHSGAQMVKFLLQFGQQVVVLQIEDNGIGFDLETCAGPKNGHFGLLGIRERAERLGGHVQITSISGKGTTIRVQIPCRPTNGDQLLQPDSDDHEKRS